MRVKWQKLFTNFLFWAIAETALNVVGLDTIADYSEFLYNKHQMVIATFTITIQ